METTVPTAETMEADNLRDLMGKLSARLHDAARGIDYQIDQVNRVQARDTVKDYTRVAADIVREMTTMLANLPLSALVRSAGDADQYRAKENQP